MIVMQVYLTVKPEQVEAFQAAILSNARATRTEPGNLRFDVIRAIDDPLKFVLVEVYRDEAARQTHYTTDHYKQWKAVSGDFFSEKSNVVYQPLYPAETTAWEASE